MATATDQKKGLPEPKMVISLMDTCLISIQEGIQSGSIRRFGLLSPPLRQRVLDTVLMRGNINHPNCLETLSSIEFLNGMTTLSTQRGAEEKKCMIKMPNIYDSDINDRDYLNRLAKSLATTMPNGKKLGSAISKLSLNVYGLALTVSIDCIDMNFDGVARLISQCSQLDSLELQLVRYYISPAQSSILVPQPEILGPFNQNYFRGGILNRHKYTDPCKSVLEGLTELTIVSYQYNPPVLMNTPILNFKKLSKLRLHYCLVLADPWKKISKTFAGTLTELEVKSVHCLTNDGQYGILPLIFPNLKAFKTTSFTVSGNFIDKLCRSPNLENAFLELDVGPDPCPELSALNNIRANVDIKVVAALLLDRGDEKLPADDGEKEIIHKAREDRYFGPNDSKLTAIEMFGAKTKKFHLVTHHWSKRLTEAIEHVVENCPDLASFKIEVGIFTNDDDLEEIIQANASLTPLFSNPGRACKLTTLALVGGLGSGILDTMFMNCINLRNLSISKCDQLTDAHLIPWADRGGRLTKLRLTDCRNVGDDGLISIINNSGGAMLSFNVRGTKITDRGWRALIDRCRYLKRANIPHNLMNLRGAKGVLKKLSFYRDPMEFE